MPERALEAESRLPGYQAFLNSCPFFNAPIPPLKGKKSKSCKKKNSALGSGFWRLDCEEIHCSDYWSGCELILPQALHHPYV